DGAPPAARAALTTATTATARMRGRVIQSTTRRLAKTWVTAGTFHEPVAHRCHDSTSPAVRSIGSTHQPYTVTCTAANSTAEPTTARAVPPGSRPAYTKRRKT